MVVQDHEAEIAAVIGAEDRRRAALVAVDLPALEALFADDLVHIHSNAVVHDKGQLLQHIASRRAFVRIERGPLTVRLCGGVAVMTGRMVNHMQVEGRDVVLSGMVTQVLRRGRDGWRFINFQMTLGEE